MRKLVSKSIVIGMTILVGASTVHGSPITTTAELQTKVEKTSINETKLFIGKIISFENGKVEVTPLFDLNKDYKETDSIFIDVTNAGFLGEEIKVYPEGNLISIDYNTIEKSNSNYTIIADIVRSVEEDQVVSIATTNMDEVKTPQIGIGDFEKNQIEESNEAELFIGVIEEYKNNKVKVKPIFDLSRDYKDTDSVYVNITDAEFPNGVITEYPEGYLLDITYETIQQTGNGFEILAKEVTAVEEDKVVTISKTSMPVKQEVKSTQNEEVKGGFLESIKALFTLIFSLFN